MIQGMDTRRLRYFVQIVDSGSITRAAAISGVAQPALSQQLAILENDLKVKLLDRSVSGVTPTAAGRILYARAQAILRQFDDLRDAVHREAQAAVGNRHRGNATHHAFPLRIARSSAKSAPSIRKCACKSGKKAAWFSMSF